MGKIGLIIKIKGVGILVKIYPINNQFNYPVYPGLFFEDNEVKETDGKDHEFYNIYVNGDFIGRKLLLEQNDKITDMANYLTQNEFSSFSSTVDGNNYYIVEEDKQMAMHMKKQLDVYLNIS
jgi:hypothetical protein